MVRVRESKEERNANKLKKLEKSFTSQIDKFSLKDLSLADLANRYQEIDQQSQLFKGLILLEARGRFNSNNEFGNWVQSVKTLCLDRQEVRTRYMNLAKYFKDREMQGISLTVAYQISAPVNEDIADEVYEYAKDKNLKVSEVKKKIAELRPKSENSDSKSENKQNKKLPIVLNENLSTYKEVIIDDVKDLPIDDAILVLESCLNDYKEKKKNSNSYKTPQAS